MTGKQVGREKWTQVGREKWTHSGALKYCVKVSFAGIWSRRPGSRWDALLLNETSFYL